ncbi:hypothetical protein HNP84_006977 [Thermocatellispora tengchongensis]|uniref:Uncharacterized protein n=1 Tax=Thermocatellispora tengchongensis TaxID=1073253 RepID=A0A840PMF2_9ACTN|nr:hypothetical protein [Thermocatellispora tengchongensis]
MDYEFTILDLGLLRDVSQLIESKVDYRVRGSSGFLSVHEC